MTIPLLCCSFFSKFLRIHNFHKDRRVSCFCCKSFCPFTVLGEQLHHMKLFLLYPLIWPIFSQNDCTNEEHSVMWESPFPSSFLLLMDRLISHLLLCI